MKTRIRAVRKSAGLNQTDFGARLGVKQTTVAGWETGASIPMEAIINSICREFNVNETWLRTGEGEMLRPLNREDELMQLAAKFLADETDDFRRRYLRLVLSFTEEDWKRMEDYARRLLDSRPQNPTPDSP